MKFFGALAILLTGIPVFGETIIATGLRGWTTSTSDNGARDYNSYFVGIDTSDPNDGPNFGTGSCSIFRR